MLPLAQVAARITDGSHFSPAPQKHGPLIANVKDMKSGQIDFDSCTRISDNAFCELKATGCVIKKGDVLLSKDGTVGRVVVYDCDIEIGALSSICLITPQVGHDARFIGHALSSHGSVRQYENAMSGSALRRLVLRDIRRILVPAPSSGEQTRVAQVLDTLDTTIRQTEAIIEKLKQVKQGLLHDLLTRGIDANGGLRPPQSQAPHLYKDSPLGWIPREWEARPLATCAAKIADRDHTTPVYLHDGVVMISPVNLYDDEGIDFENAKRISCHAHLVNRKKTDLETGDLIIHRIGAGLGRVRLITADMPPFSILHSMAQIRANVPTMTPAFMLWALRDSRVQLQIEHGTQSIGVPDLGLEKIGGLQVVAPALVEQGAIASVLLAHQCTVEESRTELNKLHKLKSGLMDDLLTGRVRVTPLLDAAARA